MGATASIFLKLMTLPFQGRLSHPKAPDQKPSSERRRNLSCMRTQKPPLKGEVAPRSGVEGIPRLNSYQERFISVASLWEIAIKKGLADPKRKLRIDMSLTELANECDRQGINILNITPADCDRVEHLPHLHEDPFDRLIISQALERKFVLLTKDEKIWQYKNVETMW